MNIQDLIAEQNKRDAAADYEAFQEVFNALPDPILPFPSYPVPETEEI